MNRRQYEERNWIKIETCLPPETTDEVLIWHPIIGQASFQVAFVVRSQAERALAAEKDEDGVPEGFVASRYFTHWRPVYGPKKRKGR